MRRADSRLARGEPIPTRARASLPARPAAWLPALLLLGCALAGCGRHPVAVADRLLEASRARPFGVERVFSTEMESLPEELWAVPVARSGPNPPLADFEFGRAAGEIAAILVRLSGSDEGGVTLVWTTSDREGDHDWSSDALIQHGSAGRSHVVRFEVSQSVGWRGRIGRMRLFADQRIRDRLVLEGVQVLRRGAIREDVDLLATAWRYTLGQETRVAALGWPDRPLSWTVRIPERRGRLTFAIGWEPELAGRRTYRVVARVDGKTVLLFSESFDPTAGEGGWLDRSVDLSGLAGRDVQLLLETTADDAGGGGAMSFWANPTIVAGRRAARPNVVLVSIDTLRADHLSLYGYERSTSPEIDRWASGRAAVFDRAISQAASTLPSHASMLTGLEAWRHGVFHGPAPESLTFLAERLDESGYSTVAVTGGGFLDPYYALDQGFERYRSWRWGFERQQEFPENLAWAESWLEEGPAEPFFLFLHTYEVHPPYRAREPGWSRWRETPPAPGMIWLKNPDSTSDSGYLYEVPAEFELRSSDGAKRSEVSAQEAIDRYDSSIALVDRGLGELLRRLDESGFGSRTIVVITSDHGELFGEHRLAGHGYLFDPVIRVPLLIATPAGLGAGSHVDEQVRLIDLLPTLLELASAATPSETDGVSLLPLLRGEADTARRPAWSYASDSNWGLSLRGPSGLEWWLNNTAWKPLNGRERIYDLHRDPEELRSLSERSERDASVFAAMREITAEKIPGLRVAIEAPPGEPAKGRLCGDLVGPRLVKSAGGGDWIPAAGRCLDFSIRSGDTGGLLFECSGAGSLRLKADGFRDLDLGPWLESRRGREPLRLEAAGGEGWRPAAGAGEDRMTVEIRGACSPSTESRAAAGGELEEQLRSLGYLK